MLEQVNKKNVLFTSQHKQESRFGSVKSLSTSNISIDLFYPIFQILSIFPHRKWKTFDNPFSNSFPSFFWFLRLILLHSLTSSGKLIFHHTLAFCCWKTWHFRRKSRLDENTFLQISFHSLALREDFLIFHEKSSGERKMLASIIPRANQRGTIAN